MMGYAKGEFKMNKKLMTLAMFVLLMALIAGCSGAPKGSPEAGEALFNEMLIDTNPGCATCHSLEPDVVLVGPSMAAFAHEAEKEGEELGMTAEEFVRESILDPNAIVPEGYPENTMPSNWGEILTEEQVDDLVAYLMSLE